MSDVENSVNEKSTVIDIKNAPKTKKTPQKQTNDNENRDSDDSPEKRPKTATLYSSIYAAIARLSTSVLPPPNFSIATVSDVHGKIAPVFIRDDGTCYRPQDGEIASLILKYTRSLNLPNFEFTPAQADECSKYWKMVSDPMPMPPHVLFRGQAGLCWQRSAYDLTPGPTPVFDELFSRMTNGKAVRAWIGSMFFLDSYDQQYVWLKGEGNDGKGSLITFLANVFGPEGALSQEEAPGADKHWAVPWVGKRFVYFSDFDDYGAMRKGPLKILTGGGETLVRPFFGAGFSMKLPVKIMIASNRFPKTELDKADKRRLIFAEFSSFQVPGDSGYQKFLEAEGGPFLASCIDVYKSYPKGKAIPLDDDDTFESLEDQQALKDSAYSAWFSLYFSEDPTSKTTPEEVAKTIHLHFGPHYKTELCFDWLSRNGYKAARLSRSEDTKRPRVYKGIGRIYSRFLESNPIE